MITLLIGLGVGLFYGWSTGVVDGQTHAMIGMIPVVQRYGAYRGTDEIEKRDMMLDAVTIASVVTFAEGKSYSPMFMFFHPKADAGLIDSLIAWELDHPEAPEFPATDAPTKERIAEVKQRMKGYWEREVERQRAKRSEIQDKEANKAVDSTATRVTPPAEQKPRPGQP